MSTLSNIFFMGSSTALRILSGLLTFAYLARVLGPEHFGHFMLWFSVATLLGLIANYGLTPYMLRELVIQKDSTSKLLGDVLMAKVLIYLFLFSIVLPFSFFIETQFRLVFLALFVAMLFDSLTEFFNTGYRASNRFSSETKVATYAATIQLVMILIVVHFFPTVLAAAVTTMVSRFTVSALTWKDQSQYLNGISLGSIDTGFQHLRKSFAYAIDFILQSLMGQVDSIVLNQMVGVSAVGIYQAGMRIFQGCSQSANILANVFIPRLTSLDSEQERKYVQLSFIAVGIVLGFAMTIGAEAITNIVFGEKFFELIALFPWLGLLFFIRFFAASQGVILTSAGLQTFRTYANIALWLVVFIAAFNLVPNLGIKGWILSLIIGNSFLGITYWLKVITQFDINIESMALTSAGLLFFIPFLIGKS